MFKPGDEMIKIICLRLIYLVWLVFLTNCASNTVNQSPSMHTKIGDMYAQANHFSEAEDYYQKAQAYEPNKKSDVMLKLAEAQTQQGKFVQAIQTYHRILLKEPHHHDARYRLARVYLVTGELEAALSQYQLLLQTNKEDYQALNGLGVLLDNLSQSSLAQVCYSDGLKYAPHDYSLLNNLGISYSMSGKFTQANLLFDQATKQSITTRPKENQELVMRYYEKFKDPVIRQQALKKSLLLKNITVSTSLINSATDIAKKWCGSKEELAKLKKENPVVF